MKDRVFYFIFSLLFFILLFFASENYKKSLDFTSNLEHLSVIKVAVATNSNVRVDLAPLILGESYMAVFRAGVESPNLHAYKLPFFRQAIPDFTGKIHYRTKSELEDFSSEVEMRSDIWRRIFKNIVQGASGDFQLSFPITIISPVTSTDFLEINISIQKGQLNAPYLEIYKVETISDQILFYPIVLLYAIFICSLYSLGFLTLTIFGQPKENGLYSLYFSLLFGLVGFDSLIRGKGFKFLIKLLTLGGCGIIYAFDLGKEFYGMLNKRG